MAFFTDARVAVAQRLAARRRDGCNVQVVVGDADIPLGDTVRSTLTDAGVALTTYPERAGMWGLHSKYLLIDAPYAGSTTHRRLVFTGSHNWTGPALTIHDETLLRVENDGVFDAYLADWSRVRTAAMRP
jgi:phosphatidylserine/phosphatidylglycerophosphate/cardiolipin synthase-like enzyme